MSHAIYRVVSLEIIAPYVLGVRFDDETEQVIDFGPVLAGELYRRYVICPFLTKCV